MSAKYPGGLVQKNLFKIQGNKQLAHRMTKAQAIKSAPGYATKKALSSAVPAGAGMASVVGAGAVGAYAISKASKKTKEAQKRYSNESSSQADDIRESVIIQGSKKRAKQGKLTQRDKDVISKTTKMSAKEKTALKKQNLANYKPNTKEKRYMKSKNY